MERKDNDMNKTFLILSMYYFFMKNGYENSAKSLFKEANLDKLIIFPKPKISNEELSIEEELRNYFFEYVFMNGIKDKPNNNSFLAENWINFWKFFFDKIEKSNQPTVTEETNEIDEYLSKLISVKLYDSSNIAL
jgi:hypothetical protein